MLGGVGLVGWLAAIAVAFIALNWWSNRSNRKAQTASINFNTERLQDRIAVGRKFYLEALQRELANVILHQDLEAFEKAFYSMLEWEAEIERADKPRREAEYNLLLEKFPNLEDFDLIGTKHFIRYDESSMWSLDDAVERYKEISKFLIVDAERPVGHQHHSFSRELEIFRERMRRYKDRRLKDAMDEAMARYYAWRQDREAKDEFKDKDYEVFLGPRIHTRNRIWSRMKKAERMRHIFVLCR
jgi:SAM-dependent methyltransferase